MGRSLNVNVDVVLAEVIFTNFMPTYDEQLDYRNRFGICGTGDLIIIETGKNLEDGAMIILPFFFVISSIKNFINNLGLT